MEIKQVRSENIKDLFYPCVPGKDEYISQVNYLSDLWVKERFKNKWRGFVAYEEGKPVGRVEFYPIENSFALISESDLYFMPCIWVIPEFQKKGIGKALIEKVIEETKDRSGIITNVTESEGWMPALFFKKFGFKDTSLTGPLKLLIKKHRETNLPSKLKPAFEHEINPNKVVIEIVEDPSCPFMRVWREKLIDIAKEFGDKVVIVRYPVKDRSDALKYGYSTVYVDTEEPFFEPVPAKEIRSTLENYLKKKGLI